MKIPALALIALLPACSPPEPKVEKPVSSIPKEMIDKADRARDLANEAVAKRNAEALPTEAPTE